MRNLQMFDAKSVAVGALLAAVAAFAMGAAGVDQKWDEHQVWKVESVIVDQGELQWKPAEPNGLGTFQRFPIGGGWEPFAAQGNKVLVRRREH